MSISTITPSTSAMTASVTPKSVPPNRAEPVTCGVATALAGAAAAASDGVSATVSLSGRALLALQQAGSTAVDATVAGGKTVVSTATSLVGEVEDIAVGAWHTAQSAAHGIEHAGEAVVDAIVDGAQEVVSTAETVGKALGHYADVGLTATGDALSEVASGALMVAAAGGKAIGAML